MKNKLFIIIIFISVIGCAPVDQNLSTTLEPFSLELTISTSNVIPRSFASGDTLDLGFNLTFGDIVLKDDFSIIDFDSNDCWLQLEISDSETGVIQTSSDYGTGWGLEGHRDYLNIITGKREYDENDTNGTSDSFEVIFEVDYSNGSAKYWDFITVGKEYNLTLKFYFKESLLATSNRVSLTAVE